MLYNPRIYLIQLMEHGLHVLVGRGVAKHVDPAYHIDNVLVAILHQLVMDVGVLEIQKILNNVRQQSVQVNFGIFDLVRTNLLTFFLLIFDQHIDSGYTLEPPLNAVPTSTYNLRLREKIRKKCLLLYTRILRYKSGE